MKCFSNKEVIYISLGESRSKSLLNTSTSKSVLAFSNEIGAELQPRSSFGLPEATENNLVESSMLVAKLHFQYM
jgi:hypothetical protein